MILTDTHTHLYSKEFDGERTTMIKRAMQFGVTRFFMPNVNSETIDGMMELATTYPQNCFPMMGLHPCSVDGNFQNELDTTASWLQKQKFVAIGEIGLDLFWDKTYFEQQQHVFKTQMKWAAQYNLPVVIHCRNAFDEIIELLKEIKLTTEYKNNHFKGIFHCFTGTIEQANILIELGFYLGIGGVVTYKNSGLDKVVAALDLKNIVLETDAPYLAPVPYRGKTNESSYLRNVAEKISEIKQCSVKEIAAITTQNSIEIFGL